VIEVPDDPGNGVLVIGVYWTTVHACRIKTVVTGGRDRLLNRFGRCSSEKSANIPPCLPFVEAVQTVARSDTCFATGACIEIDGKCVLLASRRQCERDQVAVVFRLCRRAAKFLFKRKSCDRREKLLFAEQVVDQCVTFALWRIF